LFYFLPFDDRLRFDRTRSIGRDLIEDQEFKNIQYNMIDLLRRVTICFNEFNCRLEKQMKKKIDIIQLLIKVGKKREKIDILLLMMLHSHNYFL